LRVRAALTERDVWLRTAPHLVRPMRFAIPAHSDERPLWLLRAGLLLYDRLVPRPDLPRSATLDVTHHPLGNALKRPLGIAFEYSDCVVDDSRLVVLTARDAAERGAKILTGARCVRADRDAEWRLAVIDRGHRRIVTARALANASGAWTGQVAETVLRLPLPAAGIHQMSQIVVRRLFDQDNVYVFQNRDQRLIFASPYARDFTLIGTMGHAFKGDPAVVTTRAGDVAYLCQAANRYFREQIGPSDVVKTIAGANMAAGPPGDNGTEVAAVRLDHRRRKAPLITMFGGDVTTARARAERAVAMLSPFYPMTPRWTATAPLPGGDFAWNRFDELVEQARWRWRFLGEGESLRLFSAYGTRLPEVLGDAKNRPELGPFFGPDLSAAEVRHLIKHEWARFPDDVLWRRTKLGLTISDEDRDALAMFMARGGM
jgi:glycerol-3-phosphate dehydrogenase